MPDWTTPCRLSMGEFLLCLLISVVARAPQERVPLFPARIIYPCI